MSLPLLLEIILSEKELRALKKEQNRKVTKLEYDYKYEKEKTLNEHFKDAKSKQKRNAAILAAINDDYKQVEITEYLSISSSTVSKIVLKEKKSGNS